MRRMWIATRGRTLGEESVNCGERSSWIRIAGFISFQIDGKAYIGRKYSVPQSRKRGT